MRLLQLRPVCLECYVVLHKRAVGVNRFAVVIALAEFIDRLGFLLVRRNRLPSEPSVNLSAHSARQKLKKSELGFSEGKRERSFFFVFPLKLHSFFLRVISFYSRGRVTSFHIESQILLTPNPLFIIARPLPDN